MVAGREIERDHVVVVPLGARLVALEYGATVDHDAHSVVGSDEHVVAPGPRDVERPGGVGDDVGLGGVQDGEKIDRPFVARSDRPDGAAASATGAPAREAGEWRWDRRPVDQPPGAARRCASSTPSGGDR